MVNFPTRIPDCDSHSPALLDLFLSHDAICSTMAFPPLSQFPLTFHHMHNGMPHFIALLMTILVLIGTLFVIIWDMFHGRISLNTVLLLLLLNVLSGFRLQLRYINQVKPHPSPWFSSASTAVMGHRNHFLCFYQKDKSSDSKVKFRQASNRCKRVLEAAKLAYANKTKESITSQKLGSRDFWRIANSVLSKGKSSIPLLFNSLEVLSSVSHKAKLFAENFSKNSNLDGLGISFTCFPV